MPAAPSSTPARAPRGGVDRREFLVGLVIASVGALTLRPAAALAADPALAADLTPAADWQSVLEAMFPHPRFDRALYEAPAAALNAAAAKDPATQQLLADGWRRLEAASGGYWASAAPAARTAALASIAGTPLFGVLRQTVVFTFYANPAVWAACGYEGDAWQRGGYAGPDLVTVDWLPDPPARTAEH